MSDPLSITVAVLGLGITVLQQYSSVTEVIRTYRHLEREAQRICQKISIRETRFRRALVQLITPYAGHDEAFRMVQDKEHEIWGSDDFQIYLSNVLRGSTDGFLSGLRSIQSDLYDIEVLGKKCGVIVAQTKEDEDKWQAAPSKASLKGRIKQIFSRGELREIMTNLKDDTDDFCELINSVQPVYQGTPVQSATAVTKSRIRRNNTIKTASRALYQALGLACTKHLSHKVRLNLNVQYQDASSIKFTIVFQHPGSQPFRPVDGFDCHQKQLDFKLVIESSLDIGDSTTAQIPESVTNIVATIQLCQKRPLETGPSPSHMLNISRKKVKQVTFVNPTSEPGFQVDARQEALELPNFCTNRNLCNDLRKIVLEMNRSGGPVGYMIYPQDPLERKHTVSIATANSTTFNEISKLFPPGSWRQSALSETSADGSLNFGKQQQVTMAKLLSKALLQYHETPWLEEGWDLDHILVTNDSFSSKPKVDPQKICEHGSYLDVSLKNPQVDNRPGFKRDGSQLVRNESLFRLGVMMLEIVHGRSLKSSITAKDEDLYYPANTEYNAAMRMWRPVSSKVGTEFAEVIRKCLECDFAHGSNLNDNGLQEAIYENVVQKLEDLEKALSELTL